MEKHQNEESSFAEKKYHTAYLSKDKLFLFVFLLLAIFASLLCIFYSFYTNLPFEVPASKRVIQLTDNWTCNTSEGCFYNVSLPIHLKNTVGTSFEASCVLPEKLPEDATIYFRSSQQSVAVFLDDALIYTYDTSNQHTFDKATPSQWNIVSLPATAGGSVLSIHLTSPFQSFSGHLHAVYFGSYTDLVTKLMDTVIPSYVLSLVLLFFGIIIVISSFLLGTRTISIKYFQYLGYFTFLLAIWMRSEARLPRFLTLDPHIELIICFFSLMLCPLPYILFVRHRTDKLFYPIFDLLFLVFCINFVVLTGLHFLQIADFVQTVFITHLLIIFTAVMVLVQYLYQIVYKRRTYLLPSFISFSALISGTFMEIVTYYLAHYEFCGFFFRIGMTVYLLSLTFIAINGIVSHELIDSKTREQLLKSQIKMMLSHIQPHFLFNSLGAIQSLIKRSPDTAYQMLFSFSKYLRSSITAWNSQDLIPFDSELEYVKAFTDIQLIRFRNSFRVEYLIEASDFQVPLLSIRALVENAVNHGVRKSSAADGLVTIHSYSTGDSNIITITDNGPGFDVQQTLQNSQATSGLHRSQHILQQKANAMLDIVSSSGKGTCITISIPKNN